MSSVFSIFSLDPLASNTYYYYLFAFFLIWTYLFSADNHVLRPVFSKCCLNALMTDEDFWVGDVGSMPYDVYTS